MTPESRKAVDYYVDFIEFAQEIDPDCIVIFDGDVFQIKKDYEVLR